MSSTTADSAAMDVRILPAGPEDVDAIQDICVRAFETDLHTVFKAYEKDGTVADELMPKEHLAIMLGPAWQKKGFVIKAVEGEGKDEKIVGWTAWSYRNWNGENPSVSLEFILSLSPLSREDAWSGVGPS